MRKCAVCNVSQRTLGSTCAARRGAAARLHAASTHNPRVADGRWITLVRTAGSTSSAAYGPAAGGGGVAGVRPGVGPDAPNSGPEVVIAATGEASVRKYDSNPSTTPRAYAAWNSAVRSAASC